MALEFRTLFAAAIITTGLAASSAHAAGDPRGVWLNDTGRGAIEITDCNGGLCGYVVWVKDGSDAFGCGKKIIDTVKHAGEGVWDSGRIYSPDRKKWYDVDIQRLDDQRLKVTGHKLFFSKTMTWTQAPSDLVRCNASKEAAAAPSPAPAPKVAAAESAPAPKASASMAAPKTEVAKPSSPAAAEDQVAQADPIDDAVTTTEDFDLEKGLNFGDTVKIKKLPSGKCAIDTPWVNLKVDCNRRGRSED